MNKRFFTLMAAAMFIGAPMSNVAFAFTEEGTEVTESVTTPGYTFKQYTSAGPALANGVRFVVEKNGKYLKVSTDLVAVKNGSFVELDEEVDKVEEATKFEIRNYSANALGVTFSLYADNKQFAVGGDKDNNASITFTAKLSAGTDYVLNKVASIHIAKVGGLGDNVFTDGKFGTIQKIYNEKLFKEYNNKSISLSFNANDLVGNVFEGVTALTLDANDLKAGSKAGTYFIKGDVTDLLKALEDQNLRSSVDYDDITKAVKKLSFVYVKNERYSLNALKNGEGYKLALISGADFYAEKDAALFQNAAFGEISEADQLNNEGALKLEISPKVGKDETAFEGPVYVAAIKTSATDTKTYVTTLVSGGAFYSIKSPTLGGNTYFAASEFLKKNGVSAYNIYFTSNSKSVEDGLTTEYHKYLTVDCHDNYWALAKSGVELSTPYAQWVVSNFNGRYKVTLTNRADVDKVIELDLQATDEAGIYTVTSATNQTVNLAKDGVSLSSLAGTEIKLIPANSTSLFASLSDAQIDEGIKLSFTGKDPWIGTPTYYATLNKNAQTAEYSLVPGLKEDKAQVLYAVPVEVDDDAESDEDLNIVAPYAYLDSKGDIQFGKDTIAVPAYYLAYVKGEDDVYYAKANLALSDDPEDANMYAFVKTLKGDVVLMPLDNFEADGAIGVTGKAFVTEVDVCAASGSDFAYVSVMTQDNSDKTTLPAIARHATLENPLGGVSFQLNNKGILEGILSAQPMTFWLDTADSEATPSFYISKGIQVAEDTTVTTKADEVAMRYFMYLPCDDSTKVFSEDDAVESPIKTYYLDGTANKKAIFRPAALIAEDTLASVVDGKDVIVVTKDADKKKGQVNGLNNFKFGICLYDESVEDEYIVYSKGEADKYLYSLNGKLGFTAEKKEAMKFTLGAGDPTANEAIEAESGIEVIGGQGVVTVQGAAGKVITVANILGQTIANQVAASDNVTIAAPAGIVVVSVDGDATKVIVK